MQFGREREEIEMTLQSVWTSLESKRNWGEQMKTFVDFLSTFSGLHFGRIWASGRRREMKMPLSFCLLLLLLQRGSHQDQNGSRDIWMQIWQQQNAIPMHLKSSRQSAHTAKFSPAQLLFHYKLISFQMLKNKGEIATKSFQNSLIFMDIWTVFLGLGLVTSMLYSYKV